MKLSYHGWRANPQCFHSLGVLLLLCFICLLVFLSHVTYGLGDTITGENGILELTQQVLLAIAGFAFVLSSLYSVRPSSLRSLIFAALCVTFLLRETDVAGPDQSTWLSYWLDASGKKILLAATWLLVILQSAGELPVSKVLKRNLVFDTTFWLLGVAAACLAVSWAVDREHWLIANPLAVEESSEVLAYGLIMISAFSQFTVRPSATSARLASVV